MTMQWAVGALVIVACIFGVLWYAFEVGHQRGIREGLEIARGIISLNKG